MANDVECFFPLPKEEYEWLEEFLSGIDGTRDFQLGRSGMSVSINFYRGEDAQLAHYRAFVSALEWLCNDYKRALVNLEEATLWRMPLPKVQPIPDRIDVQGEQELWDVQYRLRLVKDDE